MKYLIEFILWAAARIFWGASWLYCFLRCIASAIWHFRWSWQHMEKWQALYSLGDHRTFKQVFESEEQTKERYRKRDYETGYEDGFKWAMGNGYWDPEATMLKVSGGLYRFGNVTILPMPGKTVIGITEYWSPAYCDGYFAAMKTAAGLIERLHSGTETLSIATPPHY